MAHFLSPLQHVILMAALVDSAARLASTFSSQILTTQLLRYTYNPITWQKDKLKDVIRIEESIDMAGAFGLGSGRDLA